MIYIKHYTRYFMRIAEKQCLYKNILCVLTFKISWFLVWLHWLDLVAKSCTTLWGKINSNNLTMVKTQKVLFQMIYLPIFSSFNTSNSIKLLYDFNDFNHFDFFKAFIA